MPSCTQGMKKLALSATNTRSQCSSIVTPLPTAIPLTAAMSGFSKPASASHTRR
jgi:hypothetical protein